MYTIIIHFENDFPEPFRKAYREWLPSFVAFCPKEEKWSHWQFSGCYWHPGLIPTRCQNITLLASALRIMRKCCFHQGRRSHRIIGGHKRRLGIWGAEVPQLGPGRGSGGTQSPRSCSFFVKHIIFALKYNKQQLLLLLDKINLAAKYTFKTYFSLSTFH